MLELRVDGLRGPKRLGVGQLDVRRRVLERAGRALVRVGRGWPGDDLLLGVLGVRVSVRIGPFGGLGLLDAVRRSGRGVALGESARAAGSPGPEGPEGRLVATGWGRRARRSLARLRLRATEQAPRR